jgi:hypothetical protein
MEGLKKLGDEDSSITQKYPHNLITRYIRGPYKQWLERRSSSLTGPAGYSISVSFNAALFGKFGI